ncbi:arginase family protein [Pseudomonadota bacterium]
MKTDNNRTVRIIGVPLDLGASRRGTDMGPSALRIAGLGAALRRMGYTVDREEDIPAPAMETGTEEDVKARFKPQILDVCTQLADRVVSILEAGDFPLVLGGDHSIAMGTFAGTSSYYRKQEPPRTVIWLHMNFPLYSPSEPDSGLNPG